MDPATVTIVVVNLNGRQWLSECLDSLAAQDYPSGHVETIVVDNGSTDGSVPFMRAGYPWVKIVEAGRNLGFAGGNNLGAQVGSGEYLALINNDAVADAGWLRAQVEALQRDPDVAGVGSKMLDGEGKRVDFVGTRLNLYGRAFQTDLGLPAGGGHYDRPCEILAPCGGAMMVRRELFLAAGGFDEHFVAYYEDVDLGWRLWLMGHRLMFVPGAVVYHKGHKTGGGLPVEQRYTLSETNALRLLIKNCEEESLWQILPFSLLMGAKRSVEQAGIQREEYRLGHPIPGDPQAGVWQPEERMTKVATSFVVAMDQIAEELPQLMEKRRDIQARRKRSDREIFARFPLAADNPLFPWRRYQVVHDKLVAELNLPETIRPRHGARLLIITHEAIGPKMAGPGVRAWEMACALSERWEVMLAAPGEPARSYSNLRVLGYKPQAPHWPDLMPQIDNADVILVMAPLLAQIPRLQEVGKPTILDLYDPFELEKLAQSPDAGAEQQVAMDVESIRSLRLGGLLGDFYICASERQRDFWLGSLLASGRINSETYAQDPTLRALIDVVPFGLPADPPRKHRTVLKGVHPGIDSQDRLLLWNGGLWAWLDPLTLVEALPQVLSVRDDVKLFFAAGKHFDETTVPEMPIYARTLVRCRELGLLDRHVFFGDWVPYDERGDYLLEADLAVSLHQPTLETRFASRTRLVDCVWAGLPVLTTEGDPLSDMVATEGLGRTVSAGRPDLVARAILEMLADDELRHQVAARAEEMRVELSWQRCVEPISAFLERVAFAPDALEAAREASRTRQMAQRIQDLEQRLQDVVQDLEMRLEGSEKQRQAVEAHLAEILDGRVMRLMRAIHKWRGGD